MLNFQSPFEFLSHEFNVSTSEFAVKVRGMGFVRIVRVDERKSKNVEGSVKKTTETEIINLM